MVPTPTRGLLWAKAPEVLAPAEPAEEATPSASSSSSSRGAEQYAVVPYSPAPISFAELYSSQVVVQARRQCAPSLVSGAKELARLLRSSSFNTAPSTESACGSGSEGTPRASECQALVPLAPAPTATALADEALRALVPRPLDRTEAPTVEAPELVRARQRAERAKQRITQAAIDRANGVAAGSSSEAASSSTLPAIKDDPEAGDAVPATAPGAASATKTGASRQKGTGSVAIKQEPEQRLSCKRPRWSLSLSQAPVARPVQSPASGRAVKKASRVAMKRSRRRKFIEVPRSFGGEAPEVKSAAKSAPSLASASTASTSATSREAMLRRRQREALQLLDGSALELSQIMEEVLLKPPPSAAITMQAEGGEAPLPANPSGVLVGFERAVAPRTPALKVQASDPQTPFVTPRNQWARTTVCFTDKVDSPGKDMARGVPHSDRVLRPRGVPRTDRVLRPRGVVRNDRVLRSAAKKPRLPSPSPRARPKAPPEIPAAIKKPIAEEVHPAALPQQAARCAPAPAAAPDSWSCAAGDALPEEPQPEEIADSKNALQEEPQLRRSRRLMGLRAEVRIYLHPRLGAHHQRHGHEDPVAGLPRPAALPNGARWPQGVFIFRLGS